MLLGVIHEVGTRNHDTPIYMSSDHKCLLNINSWVCPVHQTSWYSNELRRENSPRQRGIFCYLSHLNIRTNKDWVADCNWIFRRLDFKPCANLFGRPSDSVPYFKNMYKMCFLRNGIFIDDYQSEVRMHIQEDLRQWLIFWLNDLSDLWSGYYKPQMCRGVRSRNDNPATLRLKKSYRALYHCMEKSIIWLLILFFFFALKQAADGCAFVMHFFWSK